MTNYYFEIVEISYCEDTLIWKLNVRFEMFLKRLIYSWNNSRDESITYYQQKIYGNDIVPAKKDRVNLQHT